MIPGLNHNVRYKERLFHVQTEDSGLDRPVLMTHVFIDGTIIATERSDYAGLIDRIGDEVELRTVVRKEMQEQHKLCIKNLLRGVYDPIIAGAIPELATAAASPAGESPPIPPARRSAPPIPEPRKSVPPEPTGGAVLTNAGRGLSSLSPADQVAPTERPRPSQPFPKFDELEVHLLDPSAFADEDEILASLDMLPPLPATLRPGPLQPPPGPSTSDTLLDLPAFDFAEDDPVGTLPPLGPPDPVFDTQRPQRPSAPTMPPDPPRSGLKTTPAPASDRPRFQRPQTRPPMPRLEPSQTPSQRPVGTRSNPVVWAQEPPPSFWPESPEPRATQEVSLAFPAVEELRRSNPALQAIKKSSDLPPLPPNFQAPKAPASWPPATLEDMETLPPDAEVPDFLLHQAQAAKKANAKKSKRPIRVEETSLDEIITGYLDKDEK